MQDPGAGPPDPGRISAIEQAEANPNLDTIVRLAAALGVEPVELFNAWAANPEP